MAIGDIDGDGKPEIVLAGGTTTVSVIRNTSTSGTIDANSFATEIEFTAGNNPGGMAVGDLDGDGKPEVVTANLNGANISILHNLGIQIPTLTSFTPTSGNVGATVTITGTNFDATPANNTVFFCATKATASAATTTQLTVTVPTGATFAPIKVTIANRTAESDAFFLPTFTSAFSGIDGATLSAAVSFTSGNQPQSVAIGDGDGKPDVAVLNTGSSTVSVYRNTSTSGTLNASSFAAKVDFSAGNTLGNVRMGDFDGDGKLDLAVTNWNSPSM